MRMVLSICFVPEVVAAKASARSRNPLCPSISRRTRDSCSASSCFDGR